MELKKLNEEEKAELLKILNMKNEIEQKAKEIEKLKHDFNAQITGLFDVPLGTGIHFADIMKAVL